MDRCDFILLLIYKNGRAVCFKKENMISSYLKLYSEIGEN